MNDEQQMFDTSDLDTQPDFGYQRPLIKRGDLVKTTREVYYNDGAILAEGEMGQVVNTGIRCRVNFSGRFTRMVDRDALELVTE